MFKTRLLSGILLVIIALITVITGGSLLFGVLLLISLIGMTELYKVFGIEKKAPGVLGYIFAVGYYALLYFKPQLPGESLNWFMMLFMGYLICQMAVLVFAYPKYNTQQILAGFFGVFYVAVMLSYLFLVRRAADGVYLVWLIFLSSWGCDTCAYCAGMLFGRHKLAPVLSPKKSIEGAIGGMVGAALLGALYGAVFGTHMEEVGNPVIACCAACAIAAVISQIGDLAASAIKRNHQVKDYGTLIPGHGGILDRFDSMMFTAPAIYFAILFLR